VDTRGIGELLLRQPGECSRGAQVTTIVETIDLGTRRFVH
jgi:hypothetical protein